MWQDRRQAGWFSERSFMVAFSPVPTNPRFKRAQRPACRSCPIQSSAPRFHPAPPARPPAGSPARMHVRPHASFLIRMQPSHAPTHRTPSGATPGPSTDFVAAMCRIGPPRARSSTE